MNTFIPDLIIEVTSACNRSCNGCYAPNVLSTKPAKELQSAQPELFLKRSDLEKAIMFWDQSLPEVVSIRGGEPSLHPELTEILESLKFFAKKIFIETHGRWLLQDQKNDYIDLIASIIANDVTIKISFDSMHRMNSEKLFEITTYLDSINVKYLIAVTEKDEETFLATRSLASWIKDDFFVFQKKALKSDELLNPKFGVVNVSGALVGGLNSKFAETIDLRAAIG